MNNEITNPASAAAIDNLGADPGCMTGLRAVI
jgi:hypothetical protein